MKNQLTFDSIEPNTIQVVVGDHKYILREASQSDVNQWREHVLKAVRFDGKGLAKLEGAGDADSVLLSRCLFHLEGDWITGVLGMSVGIKVINSWPYRTVNTLADKLKVISGIDQDPDTVEQLESAITRLQAKLDRVKNGML